MADISDRIRELRRANSMTQDELAQKLKVTRSAVGMYEQGVRRPDFEHMDALADLFNASLDYLMGKTDINTGYPRHYFEAQDPHSELIKAEARARAYFQGVSSWQMELLKAYDKASPDTQAAVRAILHLEG